MTQLKTITEISYPVFMQVVREMDKIKDPDAEIRGRLRREYVITRLGEKRANLFLNIYKQIYDKEIEPVFLNARLMSNDHVIITKKDIPKPEPNVVAPGSARDYLVTLAMLGAMLRPGKKG